MIKSDNYLIEATALRKFYVREDGYVLVRDTINRSYYRPYDNFRYSNVILLDSFLIDNKGIIFKGERAKYSEYTPLDFTKFKNKGVLKAVSKLSGRPIVKRAGEKKYFFANLEDVTKFYK